MTHSPDTATVDSAPAYGSALAPGLPYVTDVVVAAGLRWLVTFAPSTLLSKIAATGAELVAPSGLAAFEHSLGIHARSLSEVAIAGFDYSTLYVARVSPAQANELRAASTRFGTWLDEVPVNQDVLTLRLSSGVRAGAPWHFMQLDPTTAGWSEGDPSTLKAAGLATQRRLTAPAAKRGASLSLLPASCHEGDLVAYVPGPILSGEAATEANTEANIEAPVSVLDSLLAASVALSLQGQELSVHACFVGDWEGHGQVRVQSLLDAVLAHRFVSLIDLTEAERRGQMKQDADTVHATYLWSAPRTLARARALLELDSSTLLAPEP